MAVFFTITLFVSIVGLISLLTLKHFELSTGRVMLGSARPSVGRFFYAGLLWLEHILPQLISRSVRQAARAVRSWFQLVLARAILLFESALERTLSAVREKTRVTHGSTEVSTFLREVAEHKKKLSKKSKSERVIIE